MKLQRHISLMVMAGTAFLSVYSSGAATSSLVYNSPTGLVYSGYANEGQANAVNTVPDFSNAGYQGGGVAIPFIPVVALVSPGPGDDTASIQSAINFVSSQSVAANGFRGAVVLEAGEYTVSSPLTISTSGVVIRGAGSQETGGTRITYTATTQSDLFTVSSGGSISETGGTRVNITDSYVPVGATRFQVSNASGLSPGDRIIVLNTVNAQWITDIGMDAAGWSFDAYQLEFRRVITAVDGNQITIDAPIVQAIEDQYGGGDIYKYAYSGELENVGFECLRLESTFAGPIDENHGWRAINLYNLQNGWVRQVTVRHFGQGAVGVDNRSQQITVEDCAMLDPKSDIAGGRRYSFNIDDSEHNLVQRCLTRAGRHDYVSGSKTPGPNAFVDCRADNTYADIGPHFKYATGQIYDNVMGGAINVRDTGGAHGWTGAQILFWNCDADSIICDTPVGAMNWSVGSTGTKTEGPNNRAFGIWDSHNLPVTPRSLYYTQLSDRLGTNAMNDILLPQQKAGGIWDALYSWGGDGLFLDDLLVWADEETTPSTGVPLAIRGVVRNLPMLDRGVTVSWSTLYGPTSASFGDASALETTATFSQDGAYVLQLSADDGISTVTANLTVIVGAGSPDTTAPAAPTGLAAIPGNGSVTLDWAANSEGDLAGYHLYRSTTSGSYGAAVATWLTSTNYVDSTAVAGAEYYYVVTAVDTSANESAPGAEVSALPGGGDSNPQTGSVIASDNAWVEDFSGTSQSDVDRLRAKNVWGASNSRMAYLRFGLSGENEIGGYAADSLTSVSLDLYIVQNEGEVDNDLEVYALVDGADFDGAGTVHLSETQWTRSDWANPLIDTNLPQGDVDPAGSPLCTSMLGSHTFVGLGTGNDNLEVGVLSISLSQADFKTLINNDSNGEITLMLRSTSGGTAIEIASLGNTAGLLKPTLTLVAPPSAPVGLEVVATNSAVTLDWADNPETNIESYSLYRSTTSGSYDLALVTGLGTSDYVDTSTAGGTTYYYVVTATDSNGIESVTSSEVSATPTGTGDTTPPAVPAGLAATAADGSVSLDWDDNGEPDLGSYSIYRSTTSGNYGAALASGLGASDYVDYAVTNGTTYYYVVTAVDGNSNESAQSSEVSATPQGSGGISETMIEFGSNNDGLGGFTQSTPANANEIWSTQTESVRYRNQDGAILNSSFLGSFELDTTPGKHYTFEGVVEMTDGYADDNNRLGFYLFGDTSTVPGELEAGAIGVIFNTDDSSSAGPPGNNADDNLALRVGIDSTDLAGPVTRTQVITPYAQDLFGTEVTFEVDILYTNVLGTDSIQVTATLTDLNGEVTTVGPHTVAAADYTGSYFGFVNRARARNYTGTGGTPEGKSLPWVMSYKSVTLTDNTAPVNQPPAFTSDPIVEANAKEDTAYSGTIADNAGDPESDSMIFSKVDGPPWLSVATNGVLSGTPAFGDVGLNSFIVQVDAAGGSDTATLKITVDALTPAERYSRWAALYPSLGSATNWVDDIEPDGVINLWEYALGGDPTSDDAADILPDWSFGTDGGTNWLYYTYDRRDDAAARGLTYTVLSGTNLVDGLTNEVPAWSVSPATNGFETTTHRISTDAAPSGFMQLEIDME